MKYQSLAGFAGIGLVAAMALPGFTCGPVRRPEAQAVVGSMNRAQQAFYLEKNKFSGSIDALGLGMKSSTEQYNYSIQTATNAVFSYGIARSQRVGPSYVGGVFAVPATQIDKKAAKGEMTTISILCRASYGSKSRPTAPTYRDGTLACGTGTSEVYRSAQ